MACLILGALLGTFLAVPVTRDLLSKASSAQWRLAHTHLNLTGYEKTVLLAVIAPRS